MNHDKLAGAALSASSLWSCWAVRSVDIPYLPVLAHLRLYISSCSLPCIYTGHALIWDPLLVINIILKHSSTLRYNGTCANLSTCAKTEGYGNQMAVMMYKCSTSELLTLWWEDWKQFHVLKRFMFLMSVEFLLSAFSFPSHCFVSLSLSLSLSFEYLTKWQFLILHRHCYFKFSMY